MLQKLLPWISAVIVLVSSFCLIGRFGTNLPSNDEWDLASLLLRFNRHGIQWDSLMSYHNEHRHVIPRLYFYLIASQIGWNIKLIMFLNAIPVAITALLLSRVVVSQVHYQPAAIVGTGLTGLILGSWSQWQNFLWSFQVPWFLIPFFLVLGTHSLLRLQKSSSYWWAAGYLCCAAACQANGALVWLAILPLWLRSGLTPAVRSLAWIWVGGFFLSYLVGFSGSPALHSHALSTIAAHPMQFIGWTLCVVGQPIVGCATENAGATSVHPSMAISAGLLLVTIILVMITRIRRRGQAQSPLYLLAISLCLFGLLSDLSIAVGRFDSGWEMAAQSRYITFSNFVWLGGLFLSLIEAEYFNPDTGRRLLKLTCAGILLLGLALFLVPYWSTQNWLNDLRLAHGHNQALLSLSRLPAVRTQLSPLLHNKSEDAFLALVEELEVRNLLSPSRLDVEHLPLTAIQAVPKDRVALVGHVDMQVMTRNHYVLKGWAMLPDDRRPADAVVAAQTTDDTHFRIIAVSDANRIPREDVVATLHLSRAQLSGWSLQLPPGVSPEHIFLLSFDAGAHTFYQL